MATAHHAARRPARRRGRWPLQPARLAALRVEILTSMGGLPAHVSGLFEDPTGFQQGPSGAYFVFDRRGHAVYRVTPDRSAAQRIISIGQEDGRVIEPTGFDVAEDGRIVVADVPRGRQRIQVFDADGMRQAGFFLPGQPAARIVMGGMMLNGTGSIQFSRRGLLVSHPESGALITTYSPGGYGTSTVGPLRPTGFEHDRELHLAMNAGFPAGRSRGRLLLRVHGGTARVPEVRRIGQPAVRAAPPGRRTGFRCWRHSRREWPRRRVQDREVPFVAPLIRAAAVSPSGELWISLSIPYTYVYDAQGDKIRTLQFRAAGIVGPTSFGFTRRGTVLVTPGCYEFSASLPTP